MAKLSNSIGNWPVHAHWMPPEIDSLGVICVQSLMSLKTGKVSGLMWRLGRVRSAYHPISSDDQSRVVPP